jgi:hypothetical protein
MPQVNLLAVLLATISSFVIGGIWYGPLFGKAWMDAHGFTPDQLKQGFNPVKTYGVTFLIGLVTAYTMAMFYGTDLGWSTGATIGVVIGGVWVAGSIATNYQFEGTGNLLLLINGGYHTLRFAAMGAIIGGMG